jgi:transposase
MSRFLTPSHLASWAKLCPRTIQSGASHRAGTTGKGNPYLKGILGEAEGHVQRSTGPSRDHRGARELWGYCL